MGIGAMMGGLYLGFDFLQKMLDSYDDELAASEHEFPVQAQKVAVVAGGMHCAETTEEAQRWASTLTETVALSTDAYDRLSKLSNDYAYMGAVKDVDLTDQRYMFEDSAGFIVGDPEACIAQVKRFADMGADAIAKRKDGVPHRELMKSIELFGKYVIPTFKNPRSVVRTSEEILADIRAARPAHAAELEAFEAAAAERAGAVAMGETR
jgi:hypothetical protein